MGSRRKRKEKGKQKRERLEEIKGDRKDGEVGIKGLKRK